MTREHKHWKLHTIFKQLNSLFHGKQFEVKCRCSKSVGETTAKIDLVNRLCLMIMWLVPLLAMGVGKIEFFSFYVAVKKILEPVM